MLVPLHQNTTTSKCLARSTVRFEIVTLNDSPAMRPLRLKQILYHHTHGSYFFRRRVRYARGYLDAVPEDIFWIYFFPDLTFRLNLKQERKTVVTHTHTHTYTVHNEERLFLGWISTPFQLQHGFFLTQIACPSANALLFVLSFPRTSMIFSITLAASTRCHDIFLDSTSDLGHFFSWMKRYTKV